MDWVKLHPFMFIQKQMITFDPLSKKKGPVQKEHINHQTDVCIILSIETAQHLNHPRKLLVIIPLNGF